jgi:hypothetical protein
MFCLSTDDGNLFQKCFASPPTMETLFKNVSAFHHRWKSLSKMFCLSIIGGNLYQKCFAFSPMMEALFKNVSAFHRRR